MMRIPDIFSLSVKKMGGRIAAAGIALFSAAFYLLITFGNAAASLVEEQNMPCELEVSAQSAISDADILKISQTENVTGASAIIRRYETISAGAYKAEIILTGISPEYLRASFSSGGMMPADTTMPYIIMNEAALKLFKDFDGKALSKDAVVDWLSADAFIGADNPVPARICGIIDGENAEPCAYISLSSAKELFGSEYTGALLRIKNSGCEKSVSKELAKTGINAVNTNPERQSVWDKKESELIYLAILGVFVLFLAAERMRLHFKSDLIKKPAEYEALLLCGISKKGMLKIFTAGFALQTAAGFFVGAAASASVPSFIPSDVLNSVFSSQISPYSLLFGLAAALISIVICRYSIKTTLRTA